MKLTKDLARLMGLEPNWDSYGADPPSFLSVQTAARAIRILKEEVLVPSKVLPSVEGGVNLTFLQPGKYAHIECYNDGSIVAATKVSGARPTVWNVNDLRETARKVREFLE